jgi:hypothetical protein
MEGVHDPLRGNELFVVASITYERPSGTVRFAKMVRQGGGSAEFYVIVFRAARVQPCEGWSAVRIHADHDGGPSGTAGVSHRLGGGRPMERGWRRLGPPPSLAQAI